MNKNNSEVEKRARRHPDLSSAIGGGIETFSDMKMSTEGYARDVDGRRGLRVTKARLRFSGRFGVGSGWAEVEASHWEGAQGGEGGVEFDRIFGE